MLIKHADVAMYRAKAQGKNNYQYYSATLNTQTAERLQLENQLRYAIQRDEFVLHYQPKVAAVGGFVQVHHEVHCRGHQQRREGSQYREQRQQQRP